MKKPVIPKLNFFLKTGFTETGNANPIKKFEGWKKS